MSGRDKNRKLKTYDKILFLKVNFDMFNIKAYRNSLMQSFHIELCRYSILYFGSRWKTHLPGSKDDFFNDIFSNHEEFI